MMRLFLDSNILIDYIAIREPYFADAEKLMVVGLLKEHELWASTAQANDIFYILQNQKISPSDIKSDLLKLSSFLHFVGIDEPQYLEALNSSWEDLEDACVWTVAKKIGADAIITRNKTDFVKSDIPVFDCPEFFEFQKTKGINYELIFNA